MHTHVHTLMCRCIECTVVVEHHSAINLEILGISSGLSDYPPNHCDQTHTPCMHIARTNNTQTVCQFLALEKKTTTNCNTYLVCRVHGRGDSSRLTATVLLVSCLPSLQFCPALCFTTSPPALIHQPRLREVRFNLLYFADMLLF